MTSTSNRTFAVPLALALATALAACAQPAGEPAAEEVAVDDSAPAGSIREVSVAEAGALIAADPGVTVLDVRTPGEFAEGHIEGAVNVDLRNPAFAEELAKLDPEGSYLLHCKSGTRSTQALEVMKEQGFDDVAHMSEGFDSWKASGLATAR